MIGDIIHILNRGVEKRKIFIDNDDYFRFVYNLYDFNDKDIVLPYFKRRKLKKFIKNNNKLIVDVLAWCLMPNHYHILVREKIDGGASLFAKKLSSGYTQYFNQKNEREGVLFQGRSKIIKIKKDSHFSYIPYYIFSNPIKLLQKDWKENGIKDINKINKFLENYKWCSYLDIIGKDNFPFIINKKLFFEFFGDNDNGEQFKKKFIQWLKSRLCDSLQI